MTMPRVIDQDFIAMLEGHDLSVKRLTTGLFGGNRRSKAYGSSAEFADYRSYAPGDDLRRVDWNLYARFGQLYLKLFVDERQLHHRIYFDTSASMDWGDPKKSHTALRLGAALGFLSVQAMDRVSFFALSGTSCTDLCGTIIGRDAYFRAMDALEGIPFRGDMDMGAAIMQNKETAYAGGLSVIISDFMTDSDWKGAVDSLLRQKREVHLVRVLSRDEIDPDIKGLFVLRGVEGGSDDYRSEFGKPHMDAYRKAFDYVTKDMQSFCASRGVGLFTVCTDEPIGQMLFEKAVSAGVIV